MELAVDGCAWNLLWNLKDFVEFKDYANRVSLLGKIFTKKKNLTGNFDSVF
jgi:hypothetical protein